MNLQNKAGMENRQQTKGQGELYALKYHYTVGNHSAHKIWVGRFILQNRLNEHSTLLLYNREINLLHP